MTDAQVSAPPSTKPNAPRRLTVEFLDLDLGVLRRPGNAAAPRGLEESRFFSVSRTPEELSVVAETAILEGSLDEKDRLLTGWTAFRVAGILDFSWAGIMAKISAPLAEANISIFTVSTWDTDYVLVRRDNEEQAREVLGRNFSVVDAPW